MDVCFLDVELATFGDKTIVPSNSIFTKIPKKHFNINIIYIFLYTIIIRELFNFRKLIIMIIIIMYYLAISMTHTTTISHIYPIALLLHVTIVNNTLM